MFKRFIFSCVLPSLTLCFLSAGLAPAAAQSQPSAVIKETLPPLPENRVGGAAVQRGDKTYYLGGVFFRDGRFAEHATALLSFSPGASAWAVESTLPGVDSMGAVLLGDEILFAGGSMDGNQMSDKFFAWNVKTKKLRERAPLPGPRNQHAIAELDGRIYVAGGGTFNHRQLEFSRMIFAYNPASNTWTRKADMPIPMRNLGLVGFRGKLYAIGGHNLGEDNKGNIVQEYNPATNTWRRVADMPTPRTDIAAVVHEGRIYVLGGHPRIAAVESFDPVANTWRTEPPLPQGRFAPSGISTREGILLVGGLPNQTLLYVPRTK